ncbi:MAG: hypothetical protein LBR25_08630 [Erysipelotrichaceae bacterium]|jgi:hypothetical protein|nr:hypothetical protein [Erysipelotrichaceae bacterium]
MSNIQKSAAKQVLEVLHEHKAYSSASAIPVASFKDLKFSSNIIAYTLANLMESNSVRRTEDDRYWFSQKDWDRLSKSVRRGFMGILLIPVIAGVILLLLKYVFKW